MVEIHGLKPEDEKRLHPEAVRWLNEWRATIERDVPLEELRDDDLNTWLSDTERREFTRCKDKITRELTKCINMDESSHNAMKDAITDIAVLFSQFYAESSMSDIKSLLKKAYNRKVEEQRERKREEARRIARKAVNPPLDEAKRYLDDKEYKEFIQAARKAIDVYVEKGEDYLDDVGTFDYRWSLEKIQLRKEEERRKAADKLAAQEYNQRLNKEVARIKALLSSNAKDIVSYFKEQIKDPRYTGQGFDRFLSREQLRAFGSTIVNSGTRKLDEIVSSKFRQFFNEECWRSYFLLPSAEYSLEGVPCLNFMFDVFAVVEVRVWLKPKQKDFGYYTFELPWRVEEGRPSLLQKPEFLGYYYLVLTPKNLNGYISWKSIPLVLLKGLLNGETKPGGTIISAATAGMVAYKIPKFEEEVTITDSFAGYLKNIGSIGGMVSMGIITEKVGSIVKSVLSEFETERGASPLEERIKRKGTKKAKAFQLFSEGKGPDNPEVKALGMHKSTRYKYYKQYLATHKP